MRIHKAVLWDGDMYFNRRRYGITDFTGNRLEVIGTEEVSGSLDAIEGFTAFMQKREPDFNG